MQPLPHLLLWELPLPHTSHLRLPAPTCPHALGPPRPNAHAAPTPACKMQQAGVGGTPVGGSRVRLGPLGRSSGRACTTQACCCISRTSRLHSLAQACLTNDCGASQELRKSARGAFEASLCPVGAERMLLHSSFDPYTCGPHQGLHLLYNMRIPHV